MRAGEALPLDRFAVGAALESAVDVEHEGHAAGHAGAEVRADGPQDHRGAAGHIFAAIGAAALDDDIRARVAHREALARLTRGEQRARRRAIEDRKSVGWGKSVSVRVDLGGRRIIKKKKQKYKKKIGSTT